MTTQDDYRSDKADYGRNPRETLGGYGEENLAESDETSGEKFQIWKHLKDTLSAEEVGENGRFIVTHSPWLQTLPNDNPSPESRDYHVIIDQDENEGLYSPIFDKFSLNPAAITRELSERGYDVEKAELGVYEGVPENHSEDGKTDFQQFNELCEKARNAENWMIEGKIQNSI
ncbi:hypothetical protein SVXNc_0379 [Candidatus Nanohalococcus occultus]|uniref:Uncharacterized protein n=2 Tax=Candidatus Nanohalococcus occultus TaxID=2978047 RepID=A0ABY8CHN4_9ARCH|nr:hypothetical protein SVXNc_0379 [Candidatus Nanohaloarchaeota archaeon SVXNc]